jgi:hypothetical protein
MTPLIREIIIIIIIIIIILSLLFLEYDQLQKKQ